MRPCLALVLLSCYLPTLWRTSFNVCDQYAAAADAKTYVARFSHTQPLICGHCGRCHVDSKSQDWYFFYCTSAAATQSNNMHLYTYYTRGSAKLHTKCVCHLVDSPRLSRSRLLWCGCALGGLYTHKQTHVDILCHWHNKRVCVCWATSKTKPILAHSNSTLLCIERAMVASKL